MKRKGNGGIRYMLLVGVIISLLIVINSWLVGQFMLINKPWLSGISQFWILQTIRFVVPVLLIFVQFWIFDWVQDMTSTAPKESKASTR